MQLSRETGEQPSISKYIVVGAVCFATPLLLVIHSFKWLGWLLLALAAFWAAIKLRTQFSRHILVLIGALALLGVVTISTKISYAHMISMGTLLSLTIILPVIVTTYVFSEQVITFPFRFGRKWYKHEIAYVAFAGLVAYLFLPFYLANTKSYLHWTVVLDTSHIIRLFIGTNALGIWDELFFVGVCLTLLRVHLRFRWANVAQAVLWTTFLYELGFRGWGPFVIFIFALSQGFIYQKSKSLLYIITIHLTVDFMLFLTLIHLYHPTYLRIFIT